MLFGQWTLSLHIGSIGVGNHWSGPWPLARKCFNFAIWNDQNWGCPPPPLEFEKWLGALPWTHLDPSLEKFLPTPLDGSEQYLWCMYLLLILGNDINVQFTWFESGCSWTGCCDGRGRSVSKNKNDTHVIIHLDVFSETCYKHHNYQSLSSTNVIGQPWCKTRVCFYNAHKAK